MYSCKSCAETLARHGRQRHAQGVRGRAARQAAEGGGSIAGASSSGESETEEVLVEVRSPATKQVLLWALPPVLVLNLKRFMQTERGRMRKNDRHIAFPAELDLAPFCHREAAVPASLYRLYGVVEHHGSLHSGHYVAYCREAAGSPEGEGGEWQYLSDTCVRHVAMDKVLASEAYILFYRRQGAPA